VTAQRPALGASSPESGTTFRLTSHEYASDTQPNRPAAYRVLTWASAPDAGARGPPSRRQAITRRNPRPGAAPHRGRPFPAPGCGPRHAHTLASSHSLTGRSSGLREPQAEEGPPPSSPLRPRAACHRGPGYGSPRSPRGRRGARGAGRRPGARPDLPSHGAQAPRGSSLAGRRGRPGPLSAPRYFSPPLGTSRRYSTEARGELSRKGGSREPAPLEAGEEAGAGTRDVRVVVLVLAAAGRATPERRAQRPYHPRQAPPPRAARQSLHTDL
jgi:hypothetical protein